MDLVHVPLDRCPGCGCDALMEQGFVEEALFWHGGYGAARIVILLVCMVCDWDLVREVSEIRPTHRPQSVAAA